MSDNFQNYNENFIDTETKGAEENFAPFGAFTPQISPEYMARMGEARELRKTANIAGISLCLISVISFLMIIPFEIVAIVTGKSEILNNLLEEPGISQVYQIIFSVLVFTLPFIICYKIGRYKIGEFISFKKADKNTELTLFFSGVAFCLFANISATYMDGIFNSFGIDYSLGDVEVPKGIFGFLLYTLSTAIVPAVLEEFALRGIVLGSLRKFGDAFAIITSAICFGIMHSNFEQIPFALMVGLFLGFATVKTNSLRVAICIHFFNNFISVVFSYLTGVSDEYQNLIFLSLMAVCFVFALLFLNRNDTKEIFKLQDSDTLLTEKKKYKTFFKSVGIIVFVAINLFQAVLLCFK